MKKIKSKVLKRLRMPYPETNVVRMILASTNSRKLRRQISAAREENIMVGVPWIQVFYADGGIGDDIDSLYVRARSVLRSDLKCFFWTEYRAYVAQTREQVKKRMKELGLSPRIVDLVFPRGQKPAQMPDLEAN